MKEKPSEALDLETLRQLAQYICSPEEIANSPDGAISKAFEGAKHTSIHCLILGP